MYESSVSQVWASNLQLSISLLDPQLYKMLNISQYKPILIDYKCGMFFLTNSLIPLLPNQLQPSYKYTNLAIILSNYQNQVPSIHSSQQYYIYLQIIETFYLNQASIMRTNHNFSVSATTIIFDNLNYVDILYINLGCCSICNISVIKVLISYSHYLTFLSIFLFSIILSYINIVYSGVMALRRIMKQKQKIQQKQLYGIKINFNPNDLFQAEAIIDGPEGSPYAGGKFLLKISIPQDYPFKQPKVSFTTPIYHPGLTNSGALCCCFTSLTQRRWSPANTILNLIQKHRQSLFVQNIDFSQCSNFSDALYLFIRDREQFYKNAQSWTKKYASKNQLEVNRINLQCSKCKKIINRNQNFCYFSCGHHFHKECFHNINSHKIRKCPQCQISLTEMQQMQFYMNDLQNKSKGFFIGLDLLKLKRLLLVNNSINYAFVTQLASSKLQGLQTLDLSSQPFLQFPNSIQNQGCIELIKIYLPNLSEIYLNYNNITDIGIQSLCKANIWPTMRNLNLQGNILSSKSINYLRIPKWQILKTLNLSYTVIGTQGAKHLSKTNWINLTNLKISSCGIKDEGVTYLSKGSWNYLQKLQLSQNSISDFGGFSLTTFNLPLLFELNLNKNKINITSILIQGYFPKLKRLGYRNK